MIRYFGQAILAINHVRGHYKIYMRNCQIRIQQAAQKGYNASDSIVLLQKNVKAIAETNAHVLNIKTCIGRLLKKTTNPDRNISGNDRQASYKKNQDMIYNLCHFYGGLEDPCRRPLENISALLHQQKENILGLYATPSNVPIVRASSMVENFNYSLREQTRRFSHLNEDMKELALFYINHHRFLVSKNPRWKGKSPAEIFLNKKLPGWLDLLLEFH